MDKYNTQEIALEREEKIYLEEWNQSSLVIGLTPFLGEVYIEEFLLGFSLRGFPTINICVLFCSIVLVILSVILLFWHKKF